MAKKKNTERPLTAMQNLFVFHFEGNATEAARKAGYKDPDVVGTRLRQKPAVAKALEVKMDAAYAASGKKLGNAISKTAVAERCMELAFLDPKKTKGSIQGQVQALRLAAEMGGFIVKQSRDLTKELDGKSEAELEHFAVHGVWPAKKDDNPGGGTVQ